MATQLKASTAGTVWQIHVQADEQVSAGQVLVVLESMKMEVPQEAPCDGTVKIVHVESGALVDEDEILLEIDAD